MKKTLLALVPIVAASWHTSSSAQVLEYIDCEVRDPAGFIAAAGQFMNAMGGGVRPQVSVDMSLWNGTSPVTHTVIVAHQNYANLEGFLDRIEGNAAAYAQLINSINNVARCENEGLAVQVGAWGDQAAAWKYYAVYPLTTTDAARYGTALDELAGSVAGDAPGPILYYQNRAGQENATHFVVFTSASLASLNTFLDGLFTSRAYGTFTRSVQDIRTLGIGSQALRIATFAP